MNYDLLIIAFILISLLVGLVAGKNVKNLEDYAISRNSFSSFAIIATIVASFVGGGVIIGTAEKAFKDGIVYGVVLLGFPLQFFLTSIFIAPRIQKYGSIISVGDIFRSTYGKNAQILVGLLWISFCIGFIVVQLMALSNILKSFLNMPEIFNLLLGTGSVIIYCYFGGIKAVVKTDEIQFIVLFFALIIAFFFGLKFVGGFESLAQKLPPHYLSLTGNLSYAEIITLFLSFLLGDALIPPVIQRILMTNNSKIARKTMFISAIIIVPFCFIGAFYGLFAYSQNPTLPSNQTVIYFFDTMLSPLVRAIAISGIIAVIMSSADSYLNSASVVLANDIIKPIAKIIDNKKLLKFARISTLFIGIFAAFIAAKMNNIIDVLLNTYKFWGPLIVVPLIAIIYNKVISAKGLYFCIFSGLLTVILWDNSSLSETSKISSLVPGIIVNFLCFTLIYFTFTRNAKTKL